MSNTTATPASTAPSLSFSDIRLLGLVVDIHRGHDVDLITVRLKTRSGEGLQLQLEVEPGAPVQLGDAVRALGEMGANGRILCRRPFGEFVSVGRVKVEPPGAAQPNEQGRPPHGASQQGMPANPSSSPAGIVSGPRPTNTSAGFQAPTSPAPRPTNLRAGLAANPPPPAPSNARFSRPNQPNTPQAQAPDRHANAPAFAAAQAGGVFAPTEADSDDRAYAGSAARGSHETESRGFTPSPDAIDRAIPF